MRVAIPRPRTPIGVRGRLCRYNIIRKMNNRRAHCIIMASLYKAYI